MLAVKSSTRSTVKNCWKDTRVPWPVSQPGPRKKKTTAKTRTSPVTTRTTNRRNEANQQLRRLRQRQPAGQLRRANPSASSHAPLPNTILARRRNPLNSIPSRVKDLFLIVFLGHDSPDIHQPSIGMLCYSCESPKESSECQTSPNQTSTTMCESKQQICYTKRTTNTAGELLASPCLVLMR